MGIKFSVHNQGMEAIKEKLAQGCDKAEHILAVQILKDTAPFVPASQAESTSPISSADLASSFAFAPQPAVRENGATRRLGYFYLMGKTPFSQPQTITDKLVNSLHMCRYVWWLRAEYT